MSSLDEEEYPSLEEITIQRDEEGGILPVKGTTPTGKPIVVYPMPTGASKRIFGDVDNPSDASYEAQAEALRIFYYRPDFSDVSEETVEYHLDRQTVADYLAGLMMYSGMMRDEAEVLDEEEGIKNLKLNPSENNST